MPVGGHVALLTLRRAFREWRAQGKVERAFAVLCKQLDDAFGNGGGMFGSLKSMLLPLVLGLGMMVFTYGRNSRSSSGRGGRSGLPFPGGTHGNDWGASDHMDDMAVLGGMGRVGGVPGSSNCSPYGGGDPFSVLAANSSRTAPSAQRTSAVSASEDGHLADREPAAAASAAGAREPGPGSTRHNAPKRGGYRDFGSLGQGGREAAAAPRTTQPQAADDDEGSDQSIPPEVPRTASDGPRGAARSTPRFVE